MHNKTIKSLGVILTSTALVFTLVGCGSSSTNTASTSNNTKKTVEKQKTVIEKESIGKAVDLGAGTFTCPQNIQPGIYDTTIVGTSDGYISETSNSTDTSLDFTKDSLNNNNSDGDDMHSIVDKMRIKVIKGSKLEINDINKLHFEPITSQPKLSDTTINAGRYTNFKPGRYTITALYGGGAVYIMNKNSAEQQQTLSDGVAGNDPKSATITIKKSDVIFNSGIRQVQFKRIGNK